MDISVVIAVYNGNKYLKEQLESIDHQSQSVDEIIIIDDCSAVPSNEIILEFSKKTKIYIKYIKHKENKGYAQTFFEALKLAKGNIIFFADQDDIWENNKVLCMVSTLRKYKSILCISALNIIVDGTGNVIKREKRKKQLLTKITTKQLLHQTGLRPGMSLAIKKELKWKLSIWNTKEFKEHDRLIELVACEYNGFYLLNKHLTRYRIHEHNTSGLNLTMKLRSDFNGRITQIEKELYYLQALLKYNSNYLSEESRIQIKKYIIYYKQRKLIMKGRLGKYFIWAIKNFKMHSGVRIIIGDIITRIQESLL